MFPKKSKKECSDSDSDSSSNSEEEDSEEKKYQKYNQGMKDTVQSHWDILHDMLKDLD